MVGKRKAGKMVSKEDECQGDGGEVSLVYNDGEDGSQDDGGENEILDDDGERESLDGVE